MKLVLPFILAGALFASDPVLAPAGAIKPEVTHDNISSTYTNRLKKKQMKEMGLTGKPAVYEEDQRIPLSAGDTPLIPTISGLSPGRKRERKT